jgi:AcrR family transcriptional regulator
VNDDGATERPQGRVEVVTAVLDAATELMAELGPDAVSLRAIADRANVNYGLIHRHFGTREAVLQQAIGRQQASVLEQLGARGLTGEQALGILAEHPLLVDLTFRAVLARTQIDRYRRDKTVAHLLLRADGSGPDTPISHERRVKVAAFIAFAFGWIALEGMNVPSLELDGMDPAELRAEVAKLLPEI